MYKEIEGDLITLAKQGKFNVIAHGCNCFCRMKRGIAPQMAEAFGCDKFNLETKFLWEGDINKLGQIEYKWLNPLNEEETSETKTMIHTLAVVNAYTQYHWDTKTKPFDYDAFRLCMRKMNHIFKGYHIGMPKIGSHLAGGIWDGTDENELSSHSREVFRQSGLTDIKTIIEEELKDCNVTIVIYKP